WPASRGRYGGGGARCSCGSCGSAAVPWRRLPSGRRRPRVPRSTRSSSNGRPRRRSPSRRGRRARKRAERRAPLQSPPDPAALLASAAVRALVTGGAGFIGSHVVDAFLARGYEVVAVDDLSKGTAENVSPSARLEQLDIVEAARLDTVFDDFRPK